MAGAACGVVGRAGLGDLADLNVTGAASRDQPSALGGLADAVALGVSTRRGKAAPSILDSLRISSWMVQIRAAGLAAWPTRRL